MHRIVRLSSPSLAIRLLFAAMASVQNLLFPSVNPYSERLYTEDSEG
jgi:hypothetical protein